MSDRVAQWLEQLDLGRYAQVFAEQEIKYEDLTELTDSDLKELGIPLGPRRRILKSINVLFERPHAIVSLNSITGESSEKLAAWERQPGERKPVTMLFADITGSTQLTEKLDAEEAHDLLYGAIQQMCEVVEKHRGTVCRFMGDGVMAMFGAPMASEHHAIDACEAALDLQEAVRKHTGDAGRLRTRVGLHSGEVVVLTVGDGKNVEYDASGPTVPIAARMEQAAKPGEVYITAATQALAGKRIEVEALKPVSVKGISEPVSVFALRRVRPVEEIASDVGRTRFVGRRAEISQFKSMLDT